jgi:hypothetical protein
VRQARRRLEETGMMPVLAINRQISKAVVIFLLPGLGDPG